MSSEPLDAQDDYEQDEYPYTPIGCPECGAGPHEPCYETCDVTYPKDMQGTVDWSNVAATSATGKWEEISEHESPF